MVVAPGSWTDQGPSPHGEGGLKYPEPDTLKTVVSPSPHGEGGLKCPPHRGINPETPRPSPHGEGGLKYMMQKAMQVRERGSLPPRGGWIEIMLMMWSVWKLSGPSPHGEGGLK